MNDPKIISKASLGIEVSTGHPLHVHILHTRFDTLEAFVIIRGEKDQVAVQVDVTKDSRGLASSMPLGNLSRFIEPAQHAADLARDAWNLSRQCKRLGHALKLAEGRVR